MVMALVYNSIVREFNSRPFRCQVTTWGKLFTHMCLCHQTVYFGTSRGAAMSCDWEGNRRSGLHWPCVTDLSVLSTYRLKA